MRSAPLAAASARALRSLAALPARSPTIGFSCARAIFSVSVIACAMPDIKACPPPDATWQMAALGEGKSHVVENRDHTRHGRDLAVGHACQPDRPVAAASRHSRRPPSPSPSAARSSCLLPLVRGRLAFMMPTPASLALGIYGLFGYHALYFAALKLAPPAEASLLNSLWALFTVLFAALLPGHRLQHEPRPGCTARLGRRGHPGVDEDRRGRGCETRSRLGFAFALGCALVWSSYSVASRLLADGAQRKPRGVMPGHRGAGLRLQHCCSRLDTPAGRDCVARTGGPRHRARWAPRSCSGTSA